MFLCTLSNAHTYTVLLVDISGSTKLYEELGDERALARIEECLHLLQQATVALAGRIVKSTGDGLMCAFDEAERALQAALTMQVRIAEQAALGGPTLGIHVGCHHGPVLENAGDLYGDCVNVAVRVAGLAKPGQVILTEQVVARIGEQFRDRMRRLNPVSVKGKREPLEIFELIWQDAEDMTMLGTRFEEAPPRLRLVFEGRELWFDGTAAAAVRLGRDAACEILIGDRKTSRQHARIEKRLDKFVLVDHSSNGTYVDLANEGELCLRREELILRSHGRIGLGHRTRDADATLVEFYCE